MREKPEIQRDKHEVDVLEQVLKGVHAESDVPAAAPHVVDLGVRPWAGGTVVSAVQVQVIEDDKES